MRDKGKGKPPPLRSPSPPRWSPTLSPPPCPGDPPRRAPLVQRSTPGSTESTLPLAARIARPSLHSRLQRGPPDDVMEQKRARDEEVTHEGLDYPPKKKMRGSRSGRGQQRRRKAQAAREAGEARAPTIWKKRSTDRNSKAPPEHRQEGGSSVDGRESPQRIRRRRRTDYTGNAVRPAPEENVYGITFLRTILSSGSSVTSRLPLLRSTWRAKTASYTYGPPIDSRGERTNKTEAEACRDVDRPPSNRFAALEVARRTGAGPRRVLGNRFTALDVARKGGGIAPPTAALDATCKSGVLYTYGSPINYPGSERADKTEGTLTGHPVTAPRDPGMGEIYIGLTGRNQPMRKRRIQRLFKTTVRFLLTRRLCYWLCAGSIDPAHWPCIPDEQTCDLQILIPFLRAASSAAVGGAMPPLRATSSAAEWLMGSLFTFLPATTSVLSAPLMPPESIEGPYVIGGSYAYETPLLRAAPSAAVGGAMPSSRATSSAAERSGAVTGRPVYVPTCHRFCLVRPLTARINWRSMSIPNAAPARRVERSSGRRYAFLARHVERSGAVHMYKMPFLRAASSAAVGGAMPSLRATSSAAERLLGDTSTSLHASASVLSARSPGLIRGPSSAGLRAASGAAKRLPTGRPVYVPTCHRFCLVRPLTVRINWRSISVGGAMPPLRATSSAAERLLGDPSTSLHATASVLSAAHRPNQLEAI
ncbi:hypothetical protein B0H14DRAFT_2614053 [Mycena olivaceomarginata]|nr:hypothetical protein B0H14DRAFT_2614053 [Mycena olivaceomarginata]